MAWHEHTHTHTQMKKDQELQLVEFLGCHENRERCLVWGGSGRIQYKKEFQSVKSCSGTVCRCAARSSGGGRMCNVFKKGMGQVAGRGV